MSRTSIAAVNKYIADETANGLWYRRVDMTTGQKNGTNFGSLHAFLPGVLAMGGDLDRARRLQDSAFRMWTLHGIEPESFNYVDDETRCRGYQLRPEIVESAYYLSHYTGDAQYLEMGRTMFERSEGSTAARTMDIPCSEASSPRRRGTFSTASCWPRR